ncbi:MAG: ABC transporter ATP-binding protein [Deltaproteobacteria bacterium]|nr:ABC transporter ATP-binding protein [Deltaproteobacteria bacterium]
MGSESAQDGVALIELSGVVKTFGDNHVLRGVDLEIRRGEIFTLLGGSGTGKSVMLKHMVGLLRPDEGSIRIDGRDVVGYAERDWVEVRKRVAYVFQGAALFDSLSVKENIAYGLREHLSLSEQGISERVAECLSAVGLGGIELRMPAELSGGMRKRVGVARGIALEPEAILYDEPTTGLDPANARRIGELIVALRARLDVTSVVVTHDLDLCFSISDRVALLGAGCLLAIGTPEEIRASDLPEVREFLTGDLDADKDLWSGADDDVRAAARSGGE